MQNGSIGLGTFGTSGGTTRLFGSASNIDTETLIGSLGDAKRLPAVRLEAKIATNERRIQAWSDLRSRLAGLRGAVAALRNPPGALGVNGNGFEAKEVAFSSSSTTSPASLLGVGVANHVAPGKFELVVEQLATARKLSSDGVGDAVSGLAALDGGAAFAGTFQLGLAGAGTASITVDGSMSLSDVRAAINAQSGTSGVIAGIVKVADGDHRLILSAVRTGVEVTLAAAGGDDVLGRLGLSTDGGQTFKNPMSAAQPARLTIDGVTLTRSTNQITDAIDGVTLNLFKAEPATTVTVDVQRSLGGIRDGIRALADAYNDIRDLVAAQGQLDDDGRAAESAVLSGDSTLRALSRALGEVVSRPVSGLSAGGPTSLAGIGLSIDADNRLQVDDGKLESALLDRLESVRDVLEFRFEASSPGLRVFARGNALTDTSFTLQIRDDDGDGIPESATADGVGLEVRDGRLIGLQGTAYAGLELLWTGRGGQSIDVRATQGVADKLFNIVDAALDEVNGSLTRASDDLTRRNDDYATEIGKIDERVERYREQLYARFQAMETALSLAQSMLRQVQAAFGAGNDGQ